MVRTLILVDTYAGWKGSLPSQEVLSRVEGGKRMLAVPRERFDPTLPGLFAGSSPAAIMPLLDTMAHDVRPETMAVHDVEADERDLLPAITVPTLLLWGELDVRSPCGPGDEVIAGRSADEPATGGL